MSGTLTRQLWSPRTTDLHAWYQHTTASLPPSAHLTSTYESMVAPNVLRVFWSLHMVLIAFRVVRCETVFSSSDLHCFGKFGTARHFLLRFTLSALLLKSSYVFETVRNELGQTVSALQDFHFFRQIDTARQVLLCFDMVWPVLDIFDRVWQVLVFLYSVAKFWQLLTVLYIFCTCLKKAWKD